MTEWSEFNVTNIHPLSTFPLETGAYTSCLRARCGVQEEVVSSW